MEMQDMLADRLKQKRALSHASLEEYSKELGISKSALQKIRGRDRKSYPSHGADHSGPPSREPGPAAGDVQRRRDGGCGPDVPDPGVVHGAFGGEPQGAGGAVPGTEPFPERRAGRGSRDPERAEGRAMTSG